jgi:alpha-galactosidase
MPIYATDQGWLLETRMSAYALGLNQAELLTHRYWGARLIYPEDYPAAPNPAAWSSFDPAAHLTPEEYPGYAALRFNEPCLKITFADGVRDVDLRFDSAEINDATTPELHVHLRDAVYPIRVTLDYRIHEDYDLIERTTTIANDGDTPIMIERIWSAQWHLPAGGGYHLTHLTGRWADEMHLNRELLTYGCKVIESRRLTSSQQHQPWFAVEHQNVEEDRGEVWFGALAWSGNWKLSAEVTDFAATRISIGLNDWDFAWRLEPGDAFTSPSSYAGYTAEGFGGASRRLHDFIRDTLLPHGHTLHKVPYNSPYAVEGFGEAPPPQNPPFPVRRRHSLRRTGKELYLEGLQPSKPPTFAIPA